MLTLLRLRITLAVWFLVFLLAIGFMHAFGATDTARDFGRWLGSRLRVTW